MLLFALYIITVFIILRGASAWVMPRWLLVLLLTYGTILPLIVYVKYLK
jgi:hypothetical protein